MGKLMSGESSNDDTRRMQTHINRGQVWSLLFRRHSEASLTRRFVTTKTRSFRYTNGLHRSKKTTATLREKSKLH